MSQRYAYLAVDPLGRTVSGTLAAADESEVKIALVRRRLAPLQVAPADVATASVANRRAGSPRRPMGAKALALLTRQLATLTAVSPLEESLRTLLMQADRPAHRAVLRTVHGGVVEGRRLADAMGLEPRAFPVLYRAMVAAGESSGALGPILERLADRLELDQQVRGKVLTALVYPAVLGLTALGVIAVLMIFVVPRVVDQFDSMGQALPLLTRLIIGVSDGVRAWGGLAAGVALAATGGAMLALRRPAVRLRADAVVLALPVIGRLVRDLHGAKMARTLSIMLASGLPVLEGLTITAATVRNRVLRAATERMAEAVREGGGLSAAMRRADVFPPLLVYMTASGESGGRLDVMLDRAADYLEREFATFTAVMLSLLEPAIIVVLGGVVAVIVLSILLPILQINTLAMR